jgi:succinate dehydrogenase hydrophobic anchor subunit
LFRKVLDDVEKEHLINNISGNLIVFLFILSIIIYIKLKNKNYRTLQENYKKDKLKFSANAIQNMGKELLKN